MAITGATSGRRCSPPGFRSLGVPFHATPPEGLAKVRFILSVAKLVRRERIQIVHGHHGRDLWPTVLAPRVSEFGGAFPCDSAGRAGEGALHSERGKVGPPRTHPDRPWPSRARPLADGARPPGFGVWGCLSMRLRRKGWRRCASF